MFEALEPNVDLYANKTPTLDIFEQDTHTIAIDIVNETPVETVTDEHIPLQTTGNDDSWQYKHQSLDSECDGYITNEVAMCSTVDGESFTSYIGP